MGKKKKLYEGTKEGGIRFKSERKPWEVRVPNYVYDLWMPVLGVVDIGVYSVYCRLERENIVKAISLDNIAKACRIGKSRLYDINERLEKCGFIQVAPPEGWQKLAHHTTEITVLDPPQEVPKWAIEEYCQVKGGYQSLSPWLVKDDGEAQIEPPNVPNGTTGEPGQDIDEGPDRTPNVETLDLKPLDVENLDVELDFSPNDLNAGSSKSPRPKADPTMLDLERATASAREEAGAWTATPAAGGDDGLATFGLFCLYDKRGKQPPRQGSKEHGQQCEKVRESLRVYGYSQCQPDVVEKAAELFCERKGAWVNVFYRSFIADFGAALQDAEYFMEHGRLPDDGNRKGAKHEPHQRSIAGGAVRREVATEEEARAILGDRYRGP